MAFWSRQSPAELQLRSLEDRIAALEKKMLSAVDVLEATERMDRIIKRSFRLSKQIDQLEQHNKEAAEKPSSATISRHDLLLMHRK